MTIEARFHVAYAGFTLDVDVALPARGVSALFGPSGSGKTTLLRCLAGLERGARGRLVVDGVVWHDERMRLPPHRRPVGVVFQDANLFPHLSVLGNLRYGIRRAGPGAGAGVDAVIELLGIGPLLDRRPERLSGGERQRVAVARALAVGPRLLLMDEPLAALDLARKREVLPYLERLHDALAIPIVYVSHAGDEVARLADHLVVLDAGRVRAQGPLAATLAQLELPIRLGDDAGVIVEAAVAEVDAPWQLARVAFDGGTLWLPDAGLAPGRRVRVSVLARDVSLAPARPSESSIQNVMPGRVERVADDVHPGLALVRVTVGATPLLARLTRRAAARLQVEPGRDVWVQVKSAALVE